MKTFKLLVVTALAVLASILDARAAAPDGLAVYTTTDSNIAKTKPGAVVANPWNAPAAGADITVLPGTTVWFGFLNTPSTSKRKYFRCELHAPTGGLFGLSFASAGGFAGNDDTASVHKHFVSSYLDANLAVREYRFTPQPEWERMSYTNPPGGAAVVVNVVANSVCADSRPDSLTNALAVSAGSIGSATPGAMYGSPRYNAIWIFPAANPVNPQGAQTFDAPLNTGTWQHAVVHQTPTGEARPLGGVMWRTLGQGLAPDEDFSLLLTMQNVPGDSRFELFTFDAASQDLRKVSLDWTLLEPISYCVAKVNSLGCTPTIGSQGMPSANATNGFLVSCAQVRNNKPGLLLYGMQGRSTTPFQGGTLCVLPPIRRTIGLGSGGNPGPANDCSGFFAIDMNSFAAGLLGGSPAPELRQTGRTVDCQWWSRDPQAQFGSSLSDALEYVIG